jgi:hypothetical protein
VAVLILSECRYIVVIASEANLASMTARRLRRHMRTAAHDARFIGFTGTRLLEQAEVVTEGWAA